MKIHTVTNYKKIFKISVRTIIVVEIRKDVYMHIEIHATSIEKIFIEISREKPI